MHLQPFQFQFPPAPAARRELGIAWDSAPEFPVSIISRGLISRVFTEAGMPSPADPGVVSKPFWSALLEPVSLNP